MARKGILSDLLQDEQFLFGAGLLSAGSMGQNLGQAALPQLIRSANTANYFQRQQAQKDVADQISNMDMTGLSDIEKAILKLDPIKGYETISKNRRSLQNKTRTLSDEEVINAGFRKGSIVQEDKDGNLIVRQAPSEGGVEKSATRKTVISSINKILKEVDQVGTGFIEGNLKSLSTPFSKKQARFRADTKGLELNVIKALRGAQVSAAEEDNVRKILPSVTDSETMFKAKANALKDYLQELDSRIDGDDVKGESKVLNDYFKNINNDENSLKNKSLEELEEMLKEYN